MAHLNAWLFAADAMMVIFIVGLFGILRGTAVLRLVALQILTFFAAVAIMLYAFAFNRPDFSDLGLALALLGFGGALAFAHVVERWL
jgi:multisubunit Na+/H+ antiporter MnhF subunit